MGGSLIAKQTENHFRCCSFLKVLSEIVTIKKITQTAINMQIIKRVFFLDDDILQYLPSKKILR